MRGRAVRFEGQDTRKCLCHSQKRQSRVKMPCWGLLCEGLGCKLGIHGQQALGVKVWCSEQRPENHAYTAKS